MGEGEGGIECRKKGEERTGRERRKGGTEGGKWRPGKQGGREDERLVAGVHSWSVLRTLHLYLGPSQVS